MRVNSDSSEDTNLSVDRSSSSDIKEWKEEINQTVLQRTSINNLVMNYLVTEGFKEAAERFAEEAGVSGGLELNRMDERIRIREAIQEGRTRQAMEMTTSLHPELLDDDKELFFHLQQLVLLEMIRENRIEDAITYAQENLSERGESDQNVRMQLERTMTLLAYPNPMACPYAELLHPTHRQQVASELNAAILRCQNVEQTSPLLSELLKLLIWAQDQLLKNNASFPFMADIASAELTFPPPSNDDLANIS